MDLIRPVELFQVPTRAWPDGRYEPVFVMSRLDQRGHRVASCDGYSAKGGGGARCRFTKVPFGVYGSDPEFPCSAAQGYIRLPNPSGWGVENGHFVAWMRPAGMPTFRKVYGRVDEDLQEGDVVRVTVFDNYPDGSFGGSKSIIVASATLTGGINMYVSLAYLGAGGICLAFAIIFAMSNLFLPRKFFDTDYRDWQD